MEAIDKFTIAETSKYYDEQSSKAVNAFKSMNDSEIDQLAEKWSKAFTEVIFYAYLDKKVVCG